MENYKTDLNLKGKNYYPYCINEKETNQRNQIQCKIICKIVQKVFYKKKLKKQLIQKISCFVFGNPIRLKFPIYKRVENYKIGYGTYMLQKIRIQRDRFKLEINKFWRKFPHRKIDINRIMLMASHFDDFLDLKNLIISLKNQINPQAWMLISRKNQYFTGLIMFIRQYLKDRIMSQFVLNSYNQLMCCNIVFLTLNEKKKYIIIQSSDKTWINLNLNLNQPILVGQSARIGACSCKFSCLSQIENIPQSDLSIKLQNQQKQEGSPIEIISSKYMIYSMTKHIWDRGKQLYINPAGLEEFLLDDIYLQYNTSVQKDSNGLFVTCQDSQANNYQKKL